MKGGHDPGLSRWPDVITTKFLIRGRGRREESEKDLKMLRGWVWRHRKEPGATRNLGGRKKLERAKEHIVPLGPPLWWYLDFSPVRPSLDSAVPNSRR